jgi:MFS transporter, FHS family, glucose/mannose:H+ symporter
MNSSKVTIQRHGVIGLTYPQILSVLFAIGAMLSLGWLDNARGPIYPLIIADLKLSHSQGSAFFAFASLTSVLANFSVPFLLRLLSPKKLLFWGLVILGLFPITLSITQNFLMLLISAVVFGCALGTVAVTMNLVIEESVPSSRKRFFLSLLHSAYGLSALLAPILIGVILDSGVQWEKSFLFVLCFILPVSIIGLLSIKSIKNTNPTLLTSELTNNVYSAFKVAGLNKKILFFWGMLLAGYVSSELFFTTRLVVLFKEAFGLELDQANFKLVCFFIGLFFGRVLVSFMPVRFSGRSVLVISFLLTSLWILFCYLMMPDLIWLAGFWMSPVYPIAMDEISNQTGKEFGRYSSLIIALSSVGVVLMHMIVGYIFDNFGMMVATLLPFILCLFCTFLCLWLWPLKKTSA